MRLVTNGGLLGSAETWKWTVSVVGLLCLLAAALSFSRPSILEESVVVLPDGTSKKELAQMNIQLAGTIVTIPVCTMASCQQHDACMDRWDFSTKEGDCSAYGDRMKRMAYCEKDRDVFGVLASKACPVSCDTCPLGKCYIKDTNTLMACAGGLTGR